MDVNIDEHDTLELKLGVTGGLTETLAGRINIASWESDGWYESNNGGDLNGGKNLGGSVALEWLPNDTFSAFSYCFLQRRRIRSARDCAASHHDQ